MDFTESQCLLLPGQEQGHLSDSHTHGQFSALTGSSRNQISSNAHAQINKLGDEPLPQKIAVLINSSPEDLPIKKRVKRQRPSDGISTSTDPGIPAALPVIKKKPRKWFTENQRKVLKLLWERGLLCDNKNYGAISEITGLTTKQISGWVSRSKNKCGENDLPRKNPAPIETIFQDLSECIGSSPLSVNPKHIPPALHFPSRSAGTINRDIGVGPWNSCLQRYQQNLSFKTEFTNSKFSTPLFISIDGPQSDNRKPNNDSQSRGDFGMKYTTKNVTPETPTNFEALEIFNRNRNRAVESLGPKTHVPTNQFKLSNALQGINALSDEQADILARFAGIEGDKVRWLLLIHGWIPAPAKHGVQYKRIVRAGRLSNSVFQI